jgi:hypothetical protein
MEEKGEYMAEQPERGENFVKNVKINRNRTLRVELVGEVSGDERKFLEGVLYFMAGTLSRESDKHVYWVSQQMVKLVQSVVNHLRREKGEEPA